MSEDAKSLENMDGLVVEKEPLGVPDQPEDVSIDYAEDSEDYYEEDESSSEAKEEPSDWLSSDPLEAQSTVACREFTGKVTHIEKTGIFYLHEDTQEYTLGLIRRGLEVLYKDAEPRKKCTEWSVGDPCVAIVDKCYYRGRMIEINEQGSAGIIKLIDYGTEETCSLDNLIKDDALQHIPAQAHQYILNRVRPIEDIWDKSTLAHVQKYIVGKKCIVQALNEAENGITKMELTLNDLWTNDYLVDLGLARYVNPGIPTSCTALRSNQETN